MAFVRDEVKRRVEEKVRAGDFFFPEDLARAIATELGVDVTDTPFGQVDWQDSPTKGEVSGESPKGDKHVAPDPAEEEKKESSDEDDEEGYDSWTVEELKEELRKEGKPVSGSKDELIERLEEDE